LVRFFGHRPRDGSVVSSLHCMNDPQPEGHMASYIGRVALKAKYDSGNLFRLNQIVRPKA